MKTTTSLPPAVTREEWLHRIIAGLRPRFAAASYPLPSSDLILASVGFPSRLALSTRRRRVGECWAPQTTSTGASTILISPVLSAYEAADTLAHELAHVVTPGAGHKGEFVRCARAVGLTEGRPTTVGAGEELAGVLRELMKEAGPYPHTVLNPKQNRVKKQGTRLLKASCVECGYVIRVTRKWAEVGLPRCVCGGGEMDLDCGKEN